MRKILMFTKLHCKAEKLSAKNWSAVKAQFIYMWRALGDLLMPRRCLVCGEVLETLHENNGKVLPTEGDSPLSPKGWSPSSGKGGVGTDSLLAHLCPACAEDLPETWFWGWEENPAEQHLWHRVGIVHAASLYFYRQQSEYTRLVQAVKYDGNLRLGRVLGRELGIRMRAAGRFSRPMKDPVTGEMIPGIQAIVPVPLHPLRRWKRGYNQAEVIARGLAEGLAGRESVCEGQTCRRLFSFTLSKQSGAGGAKNPERSNSSGGDDIRTILPVVTDLLRRARYTRTQTKLSAEEKQRNVAGAFVLRPKAIARLQAQGIRHLLIVDDVMTTGATLSEAIKPLLPHFRVSVATIAFVE